MNFLKKRVKFLSDQGSINDHLMLHKASEKIEDEENEDDHCSHSGGKVSQNSMYNSRSSSGDEQKTKGGHSHQK